MKASLSLGFNIYRYVSDYYRSPWFAVVIDVQVFTTQALQTGSALPDFNLLFIGPKRYSCVLMSSTFPEKLEAGTLYLKVDNTAKEITVQSTQLESPKKLSGSEYKQIYNELGTKEDKYETSILLPKIIRTSDLVDKITSLCGCIPPKRLRLTDWQIFWAVASACGDVLCSQRATYHQRRQAMGDWIGQRHEEVVNLASLIEHWLNMTPYQRPECLTALMDVLDRLLNPHQLLDPWIRQFAYYGWKRLQDPNTQRKISYWDEKSPWVNDHTRAVKSRLDHRKKRQKQAWDALTHQSYQQQAHFLQEDQLKDKTLIQGVHRQVTELQDQKAGLSAVSHAIELYQLLKPHVERCLTAEQVDFYQAAGLAHYKCAQDSTALLWLYTAVRHSFTAWHIAAADEKSVNKASHQAADLMRWVLTAIARIFPSLLAATLQEKNLFANLPKEAEESWAKEADLALAQYSKLVSALTCLSGDLYAWELKAMLPSLFATLTTTHGRYFNVLDFGQIISPLR